MSSSINQADLESFSHYLRYSDRVLALCGAGLSAASGLPTFRGAGGLWRSHDAVSLATPEAFVRDPGLVWQFYSYRRHMALQAQPNPAHYALAELARRKKDFLTLSQNVDGLSQRAQHPSSQIRLLHGSLFDVKCTSFYCNYVEQNFTDPIVPALTIPKGVPQPAPLGTAESGADATDSLSNAMEAATAAKELDISDDRIEIPELDPRDLPQCPKCSDGLLRPGVVWFGEMLPSQTMNDINEWIKSSEKIDLILVIGTSSKVYPAAGYVDEARAKGARVAVINLDRADTPGGMYGLQKGDWFFEGDAGVILPEILKGEIGDISDRVHIGQ
ncbi:hypothetical protein ABVK25_010486 [Lepraria finkii]|uniref:Deacetylase sirtuin-type domain-containing protein n=1 Tax=Lepraria finkii TaxID=1340010 RepID=A0ABR4AX38_9LECA